MHVTMKFLLCLIILVIRANISDCIIRGRSTKNGEFPYVVRLLIYNGEENFMCGGALIGASWVLTAAHCLEDVKSAKVYLGSVYHNRAEVSYNVALLNIVVHPRYSRYTVLNDIALIKIPPTDLSDHIANVPLPKFRSSWWRSPPKYVQAYAKACGWGVTSRRGISPTVLQCGRLQIINNKVCRSGNVTVDQMCTAMSPKFASLGLGDSGAPLVLESTGELVGIASIGDVTDYIRGSPAVFTRVTSYLRWIKTISGISY